MPPLNEPQPGTAARAPNIAGFFPLSWRRTSVPLRNCASFGPISTRLQRHGVKCPILINTQLQLGG